MRHGQGCGWGVCSPESWLYPWLRLVVYAVSQLSDVVPPIIKSYLKCCIQLRGGADRLEWVQRWAAKIIRELQHLSCEDRLKELVLFRKDKAARRRHYGPLVFKERL